VTAVALLPPSYLPVASCMVQMAAGRLLVETVAVVAAAVVASHPSSYMEAAVGEFPAAEI